MKLTGCLAIATLAICVPLAALADSSNLITFSNTGGNIESNTGQTTLSLVGSQLFTVQGMDANFGPFYDCAGTCGTGSSISFTTGLVEGTKNASGGTIATTLFPLSTPGGTQVTSFGATGPNAFMVTENSSGELLGFTFSGGFSSESWSCFTGATCKAATETINKKVVHGFTGTWAFEGTVVNGVLTVDGQKFTIPQASTFELTTTNGFVANPGTSGVISFADNIGGTNFPSPVPEPGSLALFGTGLTAVGLATRRMIARKTASGNL